LIATSDGDLQTIRDIPAMVKQLEGGSTACAAGVRTARTPWSLARLPSTMANALISAVTGVHLHDYGCSLKVFRAEI
jgi:hypothetical protein